MIVKRRRACYTRVVVPEGVPVPEGVALNTRPPQRLRTAVAAIDVRLADRVLEIGCGRDVAAAMVCERLDTGRYVGVDRSGTAITAATTRNAASVAAGTARFITAALGALDPGEFDPFDVVFAVNVNVFWVRPAAVELGLIRRLLAPGGRLHLFYEAPDPARLDGMRDALIDHLTSANFTATASRAGALLALATK